MKQAKKTTRKGKLFKTASKIRLRQLKAGRTISMAQAGQKAEQMVSKREKGTGPIDLAFRNLRTGTSYVTRKPAKKKTGPTAKTKTVRRIAEKRGISRAEANKIRKARKSS